VLFFATTETAIHAQCGPCTPHLLTHPCHFLPFTAFSVHVMCFQFYAFSVFNDNFQGYNPHMYKSQPLMSNGLMIKNDSLRRIRRKLLFTKQAGLDVML
jgi:hypothetical protein